MMKKAAYVLTAIVAIEHIYILVLEMFLWTKPAGLRAFGLTPEFAEQTAVLAGQSRLIQRLPCGGTDLGAHAQRRRLCHSHLLSLLRRCCGYFWRHNGEAIDSLHPSGAGSDCSRCYLVRKSDVERGVELIVTGWCSNDSGTTPRQR